LTVQPAQEPVVDVAIVNWNTSDQAVQAAGGYAASTGVAAKVMVVDNDSLEVQKQILREQSGGDFRMLESGENVGFGTAVNLALSRGDAEFVAVSNADVYPEPGALAAMIAVADDPGIGMVGPVFAEEGQIYHDHLPGPLTMLVRIFIGSFGRKRIRLPSKGETMTVEQPSGACFVMSRRDWEAVGGFDERFFLWYEDVDLARRLHDGGKMGVIVGDARVTHLGGESFAMVPEARRQALRIGSVGRYLELHHPWVYSFSRPLLWLSGRIRTRSAKDPA
jgi:GT2 family glycosyltransferase